MIQRVIIRADEWMAELRTFCFCFAFCLREDERSIEARDSKRAQTAKFPAFNWPFLQNVSRTRSGFLNNLTPLNWTIKGLPIKAVSLALRWRSDSAARFRFRFRRRRAPSPAARQPLATARHELKQFVFAQKSQIDHIIVFGVRAASGTIKANTCKPC